MSITDVDHTDEEEDFIEFNAMRALIRAKIIHTLTIYPKLMPSMLQVGIGTSVSPKLWHPILEKLVADGTIIKEELRAKSHIGRDQTYAILKLSGKTTSN